MLSPMAHPGVRSPDRDQRPERHSGQEAPRCEESVVRSRRMRPDGLSHMQTRRLLARGSQSNPGWSAESPQCGTHAFTSLLDGRLLTPGTWLLGWSTKSQSRSPGAQVTSTMPAPRGPGSGFRWLHAPAKRSSLEICGAAPIDPRFLIGDPDNGE